MFSRILVGFDGSPAARSALRFVTVLAASDARITVASPVVERAETGFATEIDALTGGPASDRVLLDEARTLLAGRDGVSYEAPVGRSVGEALHALAFERSCDLLVVGGSPRSGAGRGRSERRTAEVLHDAPCAVCVVPAEAPTALRRIGAGFDGSAASRPATDAAARLATEAGAVLTVLAVVDTEHPFASYAPEGDLAHDGPHLLAAEVERLDRAEPPRAVLCDGDPAAELLSLGRELELLVLGGRAPGPVARMMSGSVADAVVDLATCPVLVVPDGLSPRPVAAVAAARRGVSW